MSTYTNVKITERERKTLVICPKKRLLYRLEQIRQSISTPQKATEQLNNLINEINKYS